MNNLYAAAGHNAIMREELLRQFPELGEDAAALSDTLEGVSSFKDAVARVMAMIFEDEMLIVGIGNRVMDLKDRSERLTIRIEKMRAALAQAMERANERKVVLPEATVSLATVAPSVVINDPTALPSDYLVVPEPPAPRPDMRLILQALKDGAVVPGACLSNGGLTVRLRRT